MIEIQKYVRRKVLKSSLSRPSPDTIPRSGNEGAQMNCFSTLLFKGEVPFMLVKSLKKNNKLEGLAYNGKKFEAPLSLSLDELLDYKVKITHYYGLDEIRYDGVWDYFIEHSIRLPYIKLHIKRFFGWVSLTIFKHKPLTRMRRILLLRHLIDRRINKDEEASSFSIWELMQELYSFKWLKHPRGDKEQRLIELYLHSFVETGDLTKKGTMFALNAKALDTLGRYEDEERRHRDSNKIQKHIAALTFVLAFAAIAALFPDLVLKFKQIILN